MEKELKQQISNLSDFEKKTLQKMIEDYIFNCSIGLSENEAETKGAQGNCCPHCNSLKTVKNGNQYGVQRFKCSECQKNFRSSTGLVTYNLKKKNLLKSYIPYFLDGISIKKCAEAVNISIQTSFDWRHKILSALGQYQKDSKLTGIIEADEIFFEQSQKGQKVENRQSRKRGKSVNIKKARGINNEKIAVVVGVDRTGNKVMQVATTGRITTEQIKEALKSKIEDPRLLCTDGHRSYEAFAKELNVEHQTVKVSAKQYVKEGKYHVQHANQAAGELKSWLERFNGVSTKYLQNYLNWFIVKKAIDKGAHPIAKTVQLMCLASTGYLDFQKIERAYHTLIRI